MRLMRSVQRGQVSEVMVTLMKSKTMKIYNMKKSVKYINVKIQKYIKGSLDIVSCEEIVKAWNRDQYFAFIIIYYLLAANNHYAGQRTCNENSHIKYTRIDVVSPFTL